ncbi:MAG: exosortase family protein XrtF [Winogradskyella sp.]|uniref:exosortase family protein XrtF n=1 Tax=Winogradskyella sp. TaxID=1883156 RepID=UPI0025FD76B9|nr:exosortase family protein XrtF [Winogradskyella sp.]NRB59979.1 exosortase family protein XrtF [Winogradskyella sp.]
MKSLFKKYKLVVRFIVTFLLVYGVLTIGYTLYLKYSNGSEYYPDYITNLVARQSHTLLEGIGYSSNILNHPNEPSIKVIIHNEYVGRVIEGCNGLSVIILFLAFVIAFAGKLKPTFLYCLTGSIIIYVFNLIRIVILAIGLFHYPNQKEVFHTVIFPAIIYGIVFILWMIWVNRYSKINYSNG